MFLLGKHQSHSIYWLSIVRHPFIALHKSKEMVAKKRVAVVGLGPSGAITIDALAREKAFDTIRVFERKNAPGGCW